MVNQIVNKRQQGQSIEKSVAKFLEQKGHTVIEFNYTIKGGEIDIITSKNDYIVFVEVKSLQSENYLRLEQTLSVKKRSVLIRTSQIWLKSKGLENHDWRIDFVGVIANHGEVRKYLHIESAVF